MIFHKKNSSLDQLSLIHRFSQRISIILNIKSLLSNFLESLAEVAQAPRASLLLFEESLKSFVVRESLGGDPLVVQFPAQNPFLYYLAQTKSPLSRTELLSNPALLDIREEGVSFLTAVNAELVFPLSVEQQLLGYLALGRPPSLTYSPEQIALLTVLVTMGSFAIGNAILYDSLAKQHLKVSEVADLKTQFIATVSHELSTPVHGILGMSQVILEMDAENLNDDQRRYLEMIHSSAEELGAVVDKILNLTRFQSQQGNFKIRRVDLCQTVESLYQELQPSFEEKKIKFESRLNAPLGVYGDESQIRELLRSLIENALKFSADAQAANVVGVQASRSGDMLKVCIYDSGIGIEEKAQETIFEEFRQAESDLSRSFGGAGLGLSLAKRIVELHGGRIWVESKRGQGAQFFFTLPLIPSRIQVTEIDSVRH